MLVAVVVAGAALQRLCPQKHCSVSPLCLHSDTLYCTVLHCTVLYCTYLHSDTPEVGGSGAQERVSSEPSRSLTMQRNNIKK